ncbi:hypothetical protein KAI87_09210, partial [Myxococcota bacterium]|nr:hypothetical protein [Myxococcota bacterium]
MIPGYNHNILYKDVVYHIQTEDSGVENPHIITHVFVGGNIIDSRKTSYADIVNTDRLSEMLVELMQDQHKNMLKDLIKGNLDERIGERSAGAGSLNGPAPLNVEAGGQDRVSFGMSKSSAKPAEPITTNAAATPDTATPAPVAPAPMAPAPVASAPTTE